MKKSLITTISLILLAIFGVSTTYFISSANAEPTTDQSFPADHSDSTTLGTALSSKNETVYIITDQAGTPTKTFIGSVLDSSPSDLPVALKIHYYLDGAELSASELAHKSGHIKIVFDYSSLKSAQGKLIPFLNLTGLSLDHTKFSNLKVENGKIISENDTIMVAGYAVSGLGTDLGIDSVPSSFSFEADVNDFALDSIYTLSTSELFADIDTSKLSSLDDLVNSLGTLGASFDRILAGANDLSRGLGSLNSGIRSLQSGAGELSSGASTLASGLTSAASGANTLSAGLSTLSASNDRLNGGAAEIFRSLLSQSNVSIQSNTDLMNSIASAGIPFPLTIDNYQTSLPAIIDLLNATKARLEALIPTLPADIKPLYQAKLEQTIAAISTLSTAKQSYDAYNEFYLGLQNYTTGVATASAGATELSAGLSALSTGAEKLSNGATTLAGGINSLADGANKLSEGSTALTAGLNTFKTAGLDRLVSFAEKDLTGFLTNFRQTVSAARSYTSYKSSTATSVKFLFKTPSIK